MISLNRQKYKRMDDFGNYGKLLILAGKLYSQNLCTESCIFSMYSEDYSIPVDDNDFWVVAVSIF